MRELKNLIGLAFLGIVLLVLLQCLFGREGVCGCGTL